MRKFRFSLRRPHSSVHDSLVPRRAARMTESEFHRLYLHQNLSPHESHRRPAVHRRHHKRLTSTRFPLPIEQTLASLKDTSGAHEGDFFARNFLFFNMEASALPKPGDIIAQRYQLLDSLGSGGFGEVWRAKSIEMPEQRVAIKILHPWRAMNPETLQRFQQEAKALAATNHEHIVSIHDYGASDGRHYLVMELVAGRSLRQVLNDHSASGISPTIAWVREVFAQICEGVAAMHTLRNTGPIVHRDLKPDNIMILELPNAKPVVKILDFGMARLGEREFTRTGTIAGTPEYMAPEQHLGRVREISPRTDVFALAVIFLELVTLQNIPEPTSQWWALATSRPAAVRRALQALPMAIPLGVLAILGKSLAAEPTKRPTHAGEFLQLLEQGWASSSAHSRILQALERWIPYRMLVQRHPRRRVLVLSILFAIIVAMVALLLRTPYANAFPSASINWPAFAYRAPTSSNSARSMTYAMRRDICESRYRRGTAA